MTLPDAARAIGPALASMFEPSLQPPSASKTVNPVRRTIYGGHQERLFEWFSALAMIGWSVVLAAPGNTFSQASFAGFADRGITEVGLAGVLGLIGGARIVALYINGRRPQTPYVRMAGALLGAILWGQIAWMLGQVVTVTGIFSTGAMTYGLMAFFDTLCIARAAYDSRYQRP
jgi:hypothetical protein